jgi:hypothetical protein
MGVSMRLKLLFCCALIGCVALTANAGAAARHRCHNPQFASGELVVKGVSCRRGSRVIHLALDHQPCQPSRRDRESYRGCYGSVRVAGWRCHGLFPGEGFDLHCRKGSRRIHGGAGG